MGLHFWLLHLLQMDLSPSASEASKLLEAALEQMDGIIQGAKFEIPAKAANNPVSEALRNLHTCLLREDASASTLASVEPESIEFVFNWLRNNLMFDSDYRIEDTTPKSQPFRRGGFRATAGGRLGWSTKPEAGGSQVLSKKPFEDWSLDVISVWMDSLGLGMYNTDLKKHILVGSHLLKMTSNDLEAKLNMKSAMHRKKLSLALKDKKDKEGAQGGLDHHWVTRWLDDVGLPQYKDTFFEARVDGRVLNVLTIEDLLVHLKITNLLHHLSIRRGIQVLRQNNFAPDALKRRAIPGDSEAHNVSLWSNHRVMEWLREVDLSEYAPNLRGSGVHGALLLLEPRFTADLLATLLSIPTSKTLLRRHLNIHFKELVGKETISAKRLAEQDPNYVALTPTAKAKTKSSGLTLKRKKSKSQFDYDDLLCPFDGGKHPTK